MNVQIFGVGKCKETRKAQRWFKERGIGFQAIDLGRKGMSAGELRSVARAVGGMPRSRTRSIKMNRPLGVSRALGWSFIQGSPSECLGL